MGVMQAYRVSTEIPDGKGDMQGTGVFPASLFCSLPKTCHRSLDTGNKL